MKRLLGFGTAFLFFPLFSRASSSLSDSKLELLIDWSYYAHNDVTEE
jgi:hypothetical protein